MRGDIKMMKLATMHNSLISIKCSSKMSNKKLLLSVCMFIYKRKRLFRENSVLVWE